MGIWFVSLLQCVHTGSGGLPDSYSGVSGAFSRAVKRAVPATTFLNGKKTQCTLVQALRLCRGPTTHRGSRSIALLFLDHSTRRGWGVSVMPRPLFTPGKDLVPIVQKAGWALGPVWTSAENLAPPPGIRSPDQECRSHLQILGSRIVIWRKSRIEDLQFSSDLWTVLLFGAAALQVLHVFVYKNYCDNCAENHYWPPYKLGWKREYNMCGKKY